MINPLLSNSLAILSSLVLVNLIIIFHELGHYIAARYCGFVAHTVGIGMGPLLLAKQDRLKTYWQLRLCPLGGYVDFCAGSQLRAIQYLKMSYPKKALILLGGVAVNLLLGWILLTASYYIGFEYRQCIIGVVEHATPASSLALQPHDKILTINTHTIDTWQSVVLALLQVSAFDRPLILDVERPNVGIVRLTADNLLLTKISEQGVLKSFGIVPLSEDWPAEIDQVESGGMADQLGISPGDKIIQVNETIIQNTPQLKVYFANSTEHLQVITVLRKQKTLNYIIPENIKVLSLEDLGIAMVQFSKNPSQYQTVQLSVLESVLAAIQQIWRLLISQVVMIYLLTAGVLSIQMLAGPVVIVAQTYTLMSLQNLVGLIQWLAIVNISLGFINLLPFPIFDGGRLLILTIETIRAKPFSIATHNQIDRISMAALLGLFAAITVNDFIRIV